MANQLYLSSWLRNHGPLTMLRNFEKLLEIFPYSKLNPADPILRIHAIAWSEPAVLESALPQPLDPETVVKLASEFQSPDSCYELTAAWDLWTFEREWKLAPARVTLACFGPEFEGELGESLRVDFGIEDQFLPVEDAPVVGLPMVRANVQSLLRLVHDVDEKLAVEKRLLWSESGENFAERLKSSLQ